MKRSEILENRQKVIAFLKDPARKKHKGTLESIVDNEARCCLGHMCVALNIERKVLGDSVRYDNANITISRSTAELIGLHGVLGQVIDGCIEYKCNHYFSLVSLNDASNITTQEIGAYLESVIEGGPNTPWKRLEDYED